MPDVVGQIFLGLLIGVISGLMVHYATVFAKHIDPKEKRWWLIILFAAAFLALFIIIEVIIWWGK